MSTTSQATVPVTCPHCRHEGPAFLYLLGQRSRCKKCREAFLMPRNVRLGCPRCEATLRVPADLIGREVACKFCETTFTPDPADADGRQSRPKPEATRAPAPWFETDLSRVLAEHEALRAELERLRAENVELARRDRREVEELRERLDRLAAAPEADRPLPMAGPSLPPPKRPVQPAGLARIATSTSGRKSQAASAPKAKRAAPAGVSLRDLIDRLAGCEAMTDRLITRLKTEQRGRDQDRAAFATVIERLQVELARARDEIAPGRADSGDPDEATPAGNGSLALAECGVA